MPKSMQQLRKELENIESQVKLVCQEIYDNYNEYLKLLSQTVKQQLVLAAYQICTQIYPQEFLNLSYSQREKMQKKLREISQRDFQQILERLQKTEENQEIKLQKPKEVVTALEYLEESIKQKLTEISKDSNHCLQEAGIISEEIPGKIIEMAIESEESVPTMNSPTNLLYLLVEKQPEGTEDLDSLTKISAINLRIHELEFSNPKLNNQRHQINKIKEQVSKLANRYQKQEQELAIAEAEAAWRSSWHFE